MYWRTCGGYFRDERLRDKVGLAGAIRKVANFDISIPEDGGMCPIGIHQDGYLGIRIQHDRMSTIGIHPGLCATVIINEGVGTIRIDLKVWI